MCHHLSQSNRRSTFFFPKAHTVNLRFSKCDLALAIQKARRTHSNLIICSKSQPKRVAKLNYLGEKLRDKLAIRVSSRRHFRPLTSHDHKSMKEPFFSQMGLYARKSVFLAKSCFQTFYGALDSQC